jgi:hypothetical protein
MDEFRNWGRTPAYVPPGPHARPRPGAVARAAGVGGGPPAIDVREINRYPLTSTIVLDVTASALILTQPDTTRILLSIRCQAASPGNLLVALGQPATLATAAFEIVPGGIILLDYTIPQDDIYIAGTVANSLGVLVYANSSL